MFKICRYAYNVLFCVSTPNLVFVETEDFFLDMNIIETEDEIIIDGFVENKILLLKLMIMKRKVIFTIIDL